MRCRLTLTVTCILVMTACSRKPTNEKPEQKHAPVQANTKDVRPAGFESAEAHSDVSTADTAQAAHSVSDPSATPPVAEQLPSLAALRWETVPTQLDVMRDTTVALRIHWDGVPHHDYTCIWDPGDRSGTVEGCDVEHLFTGGLADRTVKLTVAYRGKQVFTESRGLPLERLPVQELKSAPRKIPPAPEATGVVRVGFLGLSRRPSADDLDVLVEALQATNPTLVYLFLNYAPDEQKEAELLTALNVERSWTSIPVYCQARYGAALPAVKSSQLLPHGDGNNPPYRSAALVSSALFVMLDARVHDNSLDQEKWMLAQLMTGKVAAHRIVVSCLPLDKYTAKDQGELSPRFRYYEKLLRGDVSLLVSAAHPVFHFGNYGDLPTLSSGCTVGKPGRLLASKKDQEHLFTLVDLLPGEEPRVYAVAPNNPEMAADQTGFPFRVGNYVRE